MGKAVTEEIWKYCQTAPEWIIPYKLINAGLYIVGCALILVCIAMFIRAKLCGAMKAHNKLYLAGLLLFLSCISYMSCMATTRLSLCNYDIEHVYRVAANFATQSYVANYFVLIALLFGRLVTIFENSAMEITKRGIVSFWAFYTLTITSGIFSAWLYGSRTSVSPRITRLMVMFSLLLILLLIAVLVCAFCYKLLVVYRRAIENNQTNNRLRKAITKTSLLALISLSLSTLSFTATIAQTFVSSVHFNFFFAVTGCIDSASNGVCVFLTYSHFDGYYRALCKQCDLRWARCWTMFTDANNDVQLTKEVTIAAVESQSPKSACVVKIVESDPEN